MEDNSKMNHADLRAYIDHYDDIAFRKKRQDSPAAAGVKLLLEALDEILQKVRPDAKAKALPEQSGFAETENLLLKWSAGSLTTEEAGQIVNSLYRSPAFYQRFLVKLNQVARIMDPAPVSELDAVHIKSEQEILELMGVNKEKPLPAKYAISVKLSKTIHRLTENIKKLLSPQARFMPKAPAVVSIAFIVFIAGYFGLHYYQTSYKLSLAQNILQKNYRVFIDKEPRLSGGYESTGIEQLMDGEEKDKAYLAQAAALCREALGRAPQSFSGNEILAQIFYMEGNYAAADSVLQRIAPQEKQKPAALLNDLGVLRFKQKDMKSAAALFKNALAQDSTFNEAVYNLSLVYLESDSLAKARELLERYMSMETDIQWKNAAGKLLLSLNDK